MKQVTMFEENNKYIFDKETLFKYDEESKELYCQNDILTSWVDKCEGKEVDVASEFKGSVGIFSIIPKWTKKI